MIVSTLHTHDEFSNFSTNTLKMHVWESGRESHYGLLLIVFLPHLGIRSMDFLYSMLISLRWKKRLCLHLWFFFLKKIHLPKYICVAH